MILSDKKIGFAFDLHGTLVQSNEAWITAFLLEIGENSVRDDIQKMVYQKTSRRDISVRYGIDFEKVQKRYYDIVEPDYNMCNLVNILSNNYPTFLISSAPMERVERDLRTASLDAVFLKKFYSGTFCKQNREDWENLLVEFGLDLLFYIGNDYEEDIINYDKVCTLLNGKFLCRLGELGFLYKRERREVL